MKPTTHDPSVSSLGRRVLNHEHPADTPGPRHRSCAFALDRRRSETVTPIHCQVVVMTKRAGPLRKLLLAGAVATTMMVAGCASNPAGSNGSAATGKPTHRP